MGSAKAQMMRQQELYDWAINIAVEAGAVERCIGHEEVFIDKFDDEAKKRAYAIGTNQLKAGGDMNEREDLMAAIKSVLAEAAWSCPYCDKNMAD